MKIISAVAQKGGVGKSTIFINLAIAAHLAGYKVAILDLDPQETMSQWAEDREHSEPEVFTVKANEIEPALKGLSTKKFDFVLIDTPGIDSPQTAAAIRNSHLCLIPTRPAPQDLKALKPTLKTISKLSKPFAFILNQVRPPLSKRHFETISALETIAPVAQPPIVERYDFQDAYSLGLGVNEFNPKDRAALETKRLWNWIENYAKEVANDKAAA